MSQHRRSIPLSKSHETLVLPLGAVGPIQRQFRDSLRCACQRRAITLIAIQWTAQGLRLISLPWIERSCRSRVVPTDSLALVECSSCLAVVYGGKDGFVKIHPNFVAASAPPSKRPRTEQIPNSNSELSREGLNVLICNSGKMG